MHRTGPAPSRRRLRVRPAKDQEANPDLGREGAHLGGLRQPPVDLLRMLDHRLRQSAYHTRRKHACSVVRLISHVQSAAIVRWSSAMSVSAVVAGADWAGHRGLSSDVAPRLPGTRRRSLPDEYEVRGANHHDQQRQTSVEVAPAFTVRAGGVAMEVGREAGKCVAARDDRMLGVGARDLNAGVGIAAVDGSAGRR